MKYVDFVSGLIKKEVAKRKNLLLFGQNINAGSCLGGLTRGIGLKGNSKIINTQNSENSLVGLGFGLMINGVSSAYFMKQMDFLLLGVDQLVDTYSFIRNLYNTQKLASFSIVATVYDQGYQGVQSSLNTFGDFCSIGRLAGLTITNALDAKRIVSSELVSPGFRIIGLSARLYQQEIITPEKIVHAARDNTFFQYSAGRDLTIVCFNFSFPQGWDLQQRLSKKRIKSSLFSVNSPVPTRWDYILKQAAKTKKLVIIDDSKSANLACDDLAFQASQIKSIKKVLVFKKPVDQRWLNPISDRMDVDYRKILQAIR